MANTDGKTPRFRSWRSRLGEPPARRSRGAALTAAGVSKSSYGPTVLALTGIVATACASGAAPAVPVQSPQGWELAWADEFDGGALDASKWNVQTGDGSALGIPGWGNNELQSYQRRNVAVAGGHLIITALAETAGDHRYTSARINTAGKFAVRYGRVEGRMRISAGQGLWAAFWMLPSNSPYGGWPASGEIDIMEAFARRPAPFVQGVVHYGMAWPLNAYAAKRYEGVDPADAFHVYAVEWDAEQLRWFVDGAHFHTVPNGTYWSYYKDDASNAHRRGPESAPFDQPFHLLLNLAVGGDLPGDPAADAFPGELRVDYVRVYRCAVDADTGLGCAGLAAPVDPAVRPTAPERGYQAEYVLYGDAAGPLVVAAADGDGETTPDVEMAVPLRIHVNAAGGALAFAEVQDADTRGRVIDLATSGGGSLAIGAAAATRLRLFGMGPVAEANLAGEIQFDLYIVGEATDPAAALRVKLDSGALEAGVAELPVADLPSNRWTTVTVQIGDIVRNAGAAGVDLGRIRNLFVLEAAGAVHLRLDAVRIRCGHKHRHGCGIAPSLQPEG